MTETLYEPLVLPEDEAATVHHNLRAIHAENNTLVRNSDAKDVIERRRENRAPAIVYHLFICSLLIVLFVGIAQGTAFDVVPWFVPRDSLHNSLAKPTELWSLPQVHRGGMKMDFLNPPQAPPGADQQLGQSFSLPERVSMEICCPHLPSNSRNDGGRRRSVRKTRSDPWEQASKGLCSSGVELLSINPQQLRQFGSALCSAGTSMKDAPKSLEDTGIVLTAVAAAAHNSPLVGTAQFFGDAGEAILDATDMLGRAEAACSVPLMKVAEAHVSQDAAAALGNAAFVMDHASAKQWEVHLRLQAISAWLSSVSSSLADVRFELPEKCSVVNSTAVPEVADESKTGAEDQDGTEEVPATESSIDHVAESLQAVINDESRVDDAAAENATEMSAAVPRDASINEADADAAANESRTDAQSEAEVTVGLREASELDAMTEASAAVKSEEPEFSRAGGSSTS
eukprot:gnl/TRDRNA2_/TRDRNA2_40110_c0_seq1.p1 gnl/TRDRNA2_/TRDRNA2_40110_c0~~gnl/TRDRNA2_/TRDRNA2_40110_c0_seq1.p1  ORF type:complete len:457 (+),score=66.40 gnl/TRDRNA2_/TRDRNA2_40110_c0_seq1:30-1400(+)